MGRGWWLAGLLAYISIICIPWGKACFVIGQFAFFPFGKEAVSRFVFGLLLLVNMLLQVG